MLLMWLVMNLVILQMVCVTKLFLSKLLKHDTDMMWFHLIVFVGNTYENGWTEEKYPIIYTTFCCSGSETRLSKCSPSISSNIQYCSNYQAVKLTCEGQYHLIFCLNC